MKNKLAGINSRPPGIKTSKNKQQLGNSQKQHIKNQQRATRIQERTSRNQQQATMNQE